MAEKILMNKNSLATLKIELSEYKEALPVFEMKEQQLKSIVHQVEDGIEALRKDIDDTNERVKSWIAVITDESVDLSSMVQLDKIETEEQELVGVTVDQYIAVHFQDYNQDLFNTPLWVDEALEEIKEQKTNRIILSIEQKKLERLKEELSEARRMKNALKEVFIPETIRTIRKIEIYLGDIERLAIGCAKLVKKKKQKKQLSL